MIKQSILNLFQDNAVGAISARDMRIFVNTIFDSKENNVQIFEKLQDINTYLGSDNYPISKDDLIVITDHNNQSQIKETGVYIALKDKPTSNDVLKIANLNYDEFLKQGQNGQVVSITDGELTWMEPLPGYFIKGVKKISLILQERPEIGTIYIAEDTNLTAPVPGKEGDGYSYGVDGWINIGPLRGPAGDVTEVAFAQQFEVNAGIIDNKAISPLTFENSLQLRKKEDTLGNPTQDGYILVSDTDGTRYWEEKPNSGVWGNITGIIDHQADLQAQFDSKEDFLGRPASPKQILSSDPDGTRFWIDYEPGIQEVYWGQIKGDIITQTDLIQELNKKVSTTGGTINGSLDITSSLNVSGNVIFNDELLVQNKIHTGTVTLDGILYVGLNTSNVSEIQFKKYNDTSVGRFGFYDTDFYISTSTYTNAKVWNSKNHGAGSGLDADLLDGKHAFDFVPAGGGTVVGDYEFTGAVKSKDVIGAYSGVEGVYLTPQYLELRKDLDFFRIQKDASTGVEFKINDKTIISMEYDKAPETQYQPTDDSHLTRKDYVDNSVLNKVTKTGDIMTGNLYVDINNTVISKLDSWGLSFDDSINNEEVEFLYNPNERNFDFKFNADTSFTVNRQQAPSTKYQPTEVNHLTRKDYVDGLVAPLLEKIEELEKKILEIKKSAN